MCLPTADPSFRCLLYDLQPQLRRWCAEVLTCFNTPTLRVISCPARIVEDSPHPAKRARIHPALAAGAMDPAEAVRLVEHAAVLLGVDPQAASKQLLELRANPKAPGIARYVLEHSSCPAAQFQAATMLQTSLLERWQEIPPDERTGWRNYLANQLIHGVDKLPHFVTAQMMQAFAVLWKRGWSEESLDAKHQLFQHLLQLAQNPDKAVLASRYLSALVGEFSTTKSAAIGLPLEFHRHAHRAFQDYGLLPSLELAMAMMGQTVDAILASPDAVGRTDLMRRLEASVALCVEVLSWDFGGFDPLHEPLVNQFISPPITWRSLLIRPDLLAAILQVYCMVRVAAVGQEERAHLLRQLLTQLASVQGPIYANGEDRRKYASYIVDGASRLLHDALTAALDAMRRGDQGGVERFGGETTALCQLMQVCVSNFRLSVLASLPSFPELCQRLAHASTQLLEASAAMANAFNGNNDDFDAVVQGWTMESFNLLLEAWVVLIEDPTLNIVGSTSPTNKAVLSTTATAQSSSTTASDHHQHTIDWEATCRAIVESASPLYHTYGMCRITLGRVEASRAVTEEEQDDEAEIAEESMTDQLGSMASIGRLCPASSLMALKQLMLSHDAGCLPRLQRLLDGTDRELYKNDASVCGLMEETRVVILATGHLLADACEGEAPAVPEPIHRLCFAHTHTYGRTHSISPFPALTDAIVEVVHSVMVLGNILLQRVIADPLDPLVSPVVVDSVLWFLTRWSRTYLLPDPKLYKAGIISPSLLSAYGPSPKGSGPAVVDALLQVAWGFITRWPSQADVAVGACGVVRALVSGAVVTPVTVRLESWAQLLHALAAERSLSPGQPPPPELGYVRLPAHARGLLLEVVVGGILAREEEGDAAATSLMQVAGPLEARLHHVLGIAGQNGGKGTSATLALSQQVATLAGLYAGVARAVDNTGRRLLPRLITAALDPLVRAASACQSYPEAIQAVLGLLRDYAEVHISSLAASETMSLLTASGMALRAYAAQNVGRHRADANANDEAQADLLCVLQLLSHLASKDYVDFSDTDADGTRIAVDTVAEVVFFGLEQVIPLMSERLLDVPHLGKQYFTLANSMVSTYTGRVATLAHPLFMQLVNSVLFGIQRPDSEIARDSLRALAGLALFHAKAMQDGSSPGLTLHLQAEPRLLADSVRKLLQMVVFETSIWDRLDAASNAILALVLCDRGGFGAMLGDILEREPPATRDRLRREFEELLTAVPPQGGLADRQSKLAFRDRLKVFAQRVRPFMQMR